MQSTMWIPTIFGPFFIIIGLWCLCYHENMMKVVTSIKNTPAALYLWSAINLFLGLLVINTYNVWVANWSLLVTLLGWGLLVRGLLGLFMSQGILTMHWGNQSWLKVWSIITLLWGLGLCYIAFWS